MKRDIDTNCTKNPQKLNDCNDTFDAFDEDVQYQKIDVPIDEFFNSNINPNFTFEEKNNIRYILEEAKNKCIMLKSFKRIISEEPPPTVERIALKKAISILEELIDEGRLPIYNKKDGFVCPYKRILGDYIQKDHPEFEFYADQTNKKYVQIIYEIIALFGMGTTTDMYIGHTAFTKKERMITHLHESLKIFVKIYDSKAQSSLNNWLNFDEDSSFESNDYYPSRVILKTFLEGLKRLKRFKSFKELFTYSKRLILSNGDSIIQYEEIVNELLGKKLISMNILEVHFSTKFLYKNENWYKLPKNYVEKGTIYPEGLNMLDRTEGKTDYRIIPLYDTAFLVALGYKPPIIVGMLNELYREEFNETLIRNRLKEYFNKSYYNELLKPVFQEVLEKNPNLNRKLIAKAINRGKDFFYGDKFKQWYGDSVSIKNLQNVLRSKKLHGDKFNWCDTQKEIADYHKNQIIKGIQKSQWISWFIDNRVGIDEIGEKTGYSDGRSFSNHFWKLKRVQEIFGVSNMREAIVKYRRKRVIKEVKEDPSPSIMTLKRIFVDIFGYRKKQNYYKSSYYWEIMSKVFREIFPELEISEYLSPKQFIQELVLRISTVDK